MLCCCRLKVLVPCVLIPGCPENALHIQELWMEAMNKIICITQSLPVMIFITFLLSWLSDFQQTVHVDLWMRRRPEIGRLQWPQLGSGSSSRGANPQSVPCSNSPSQVPLPIQFAASSPWPSLTLSVTLLIILLPCS